MSPVNLLRSVVLMLMWALVAACNGPRQFECDAERSCGFGSTCEAGFCVEGRCATSAQCPMENYCDRRQCVGGCEGDGDCYPGSRCDRELGTCVEAGCVETKVDCGYREFCNAATGDCFDAGDKYCKFCNDDVECGAGNLCLAHYCGVDCSGGRDCPAGFECYPFGDSFGNVVAYQCFTYCWMFDDYEPGSFVQAPPAAPAGPWPVSPVTLEAVGP